MTVPKDRTAAEHLADPDALIVTRSSSAGMDELFIAIHADGRVTAFNGHVDLGTGIRTSLAQIVAEELCVSFEAVSLVLGSTSVAPNQGATIASETIQVAAIPLRAAAATARRFLLDEAAARLGRPAGDLVAEAGVVRVSGEGAANAFVPFGDLVAGRSLRLALDPQAPLKPRSSYTIVGRPQARTDIAAKASGSFTYVHDVRVPGMLHGRVVRPPYAGFDAGPHVGTSLIAVDEASVAEIPGRVAVVAIGDFVGVVAVREEDAVEAMKRLRVAWRPAPLIPDLNAPEEALRANPSSARTLADRGDADGAFDGAAETMERTYVWPYQMHGSIGPSCAVADWREETLTVWSGTQNPFPMRTDLSRLLDMPEERITVERLEAAGCYGRNCADDVTADAALLSRAVGAPVRVQLTREQEHAWEPKGAAQVVDVRGGLDREGGPALYDFETRYPSNLAPTLPLILTGKLAPVAAIAEMGDRTAIPPYAFPNLRVTVHDMPPIARASWFRGVSAMPNTFAHESFIDELATAAKVDPIEYRLRYLTDPRAVDLVRAVAERAAWVPHTAPFTHGGEGDILYGRGFAYAVYVHGKFPGTAAAWAAWVADVAVNKATGEIAVTRVTCGQDTGEMVNPNGVRHQIHGNVIQSTSRVLKEEVRFSQTGVASLEWGAYPILRFPDVPEVDVLLMERPDEPPLGAGESASVPSAAAIANAIFDATGVRFRELPLTPERVRAALNPLAHPPPPPERAPAPRAAKRRRWFGSVAGVFAGLLAAGAAVLPWRPPIAPAERPAADLFSSATIERGRLAAAAGACNVCHIGSDGTPFAGGRALETPFGTVYATNITPDAEAGIGAWTYPAFERAMRQGVSRDGHFLYPAHPYTSFAGTSERDLQALYAYLMAAAPSAAKVPETSLRFPFGFRPLMAGWNALFLSTSPALADPAKSAVWNRGAELVEGLGHCSACHSPRNALGAEKTGEAHLAGGHADGWDAPALTSLSVAPVAWTQDAFYDYLRTGRSADHGAAAGPMAHVVESFRDLPDADILAMATYLGSLTAKPAPSADSATVIIAADATASSAAAAEPIGARIFEGACASCHGDDSELTPLALNTALHAAEPTNTIQAIRLGIPVPFGLDAQAMAMPAFAGTLDDASTASLVRYLRARFAPDKAPWTAVSTAVSTGGR
ncbi:MULTISPECIES: molybdopterin cofactor-binding domain-containing protein [unclassified Aureimonas]|uniref:molybdopterin cofactor-binding domain-containing protein n=1 Tax=unclassified Aureimonas TaxID=2615206 RepID=UPI0006F793A2|nr:MULTISPECIES: molybdopterin cofactor-binding domain-containing protein [unclassified Aureimonas]KQT55211.1 aldehyde dehydrogenase [Aureimonas sp. Leaf427]KQT71002.1 aldehyde dehydrogenase [Aureimonas sp. Leaf460]